MYVQACLGLCSGSLRPRRGTRPFTRHHADRAHLPKQVLAAAPHSWKRQPAQRYFFWRRCCASRSCGRNTMRTAQRALTPTSWTARCSSPCSSAGALRCEAVFFRAVFFCMVFFAMCTSACVHHVSPGVCAHFTIPCHQAASSCSCSSPALWFPNAATASSTSSAS